MSRTTGSTRKSAIKRRPRSGRLYGVGAAVVIALFAVGCGDSDSSAEPADNTTATTTTNEPEDTVEANLVRDDIESSAETAPADEDADESSGGGYLELAYWEGALPDGWSRVQQPDEECDNSDPDVRVCEFTETANLMATHIGYVSETQSGTATTYLTETCEAPVGTSSHTVREASGTITTKWGDELHFEYRTDSCTVAPETFYWLVTGGTGRFEGASGLMSAVRPAMQAGFLQVSTGTLTVKADLWEHILPAVG